MNRPAMRDEIKLKSFSVIWPLLRNSRLELINLSCEIFAEVSLPDGSLNRIRCVFSRSVVVRGTAKSESALNTFITSTGRSKELFFPFTSTPILCPRLAHQTSRTDAIGRTELDALILAFNTVHSNNFMRSKNDIDMMW
jgi:hypothetical protein